MNKRLIKFNYADVEPIARKYFIEASGLSPDAKNHKQLLDEALQVLLDCKTQMNIKAVVIPMKANVFYDSIIHMSKSDFACTAFEQISADSILAIYAYLISLGECKLDVKNQAEQYYLHLWANSFMEAGKQLLRESIGEAENILSKDEFISCSFGPGSYGMSPDKLEEMLDEIDDTMVGRALSKDDNISKEKLCGGFFFITKNQGVLPPLECKDCIGHDKGCMFCGGKNVIPSKKTCMELLNSYGTPPHVIRHCIAVSRTALRIAEALNEKGGNLNLSLLEAACLLHDIARVEENHGVKGAIVLEKCGYRQVAKLVKSHMFYATDPNKEIITEQDLLCLADRMVKEDKYVGLDVRMRFVLDKLTSLGVSTDRVRHRMAETQSLRDRIEKIIGIPIDTLME
ncbi:MAG TPA: HD domain-containing protein [Anaerovoracaceae bacterium]|nr:HD domain-containing protein [Anaerovoracaceae bacterium]